MSIWQRPPDLQQLNENRKNTIVELLDIRFEAFDEDSITASMVVDSRTHQPYGLLHGGASVVLAETAGSMASYLCIDPEQFYCVGLEVNANHLRALRSGRVTAVCRPVHLGRSSHVWDIRLSGDDGKLSCISRLTVAVVPLGDTSPRRLEAS
ncbi:hotdog fold thioesterase [Stutzerimonas zhaodongensis]|uniref:Hotdog fold thioesterase n=1 Tax=Stutzerimonas zhaodongensis TaxID=1176257 RepID=A0A3M2HXE7_9GAMM|nr:hotdog fold thioesterase [Stutzerimonas zhaodongensis]MCQ4314575.1 hotdog fold thioesterase [Stutzerimonas zhaodongensis]RMH92089.1 hotdog fold thioesterase [Stutzerimonas zhaodongensis]